MIHLSVQDPRFFCSGQKRDSGQRGSYNGLNCMAKGLRLDIMLELLEANVLMIPRLPDFVKIPIFWGERLLGLRSV